jgi:hypothetical protein
MTASGEGIHVVHCPDNRLRVWHSGKKSVIVDKIDNPMEIDHFAGRQLTNKISPVLRSVSAKGLIADGKAFPIPREAVRDLFSSQTAA